MVGANRVILILLYLIIIMKHIVFIGLSLSLLLLNQILFSQEPYHPYTAMAYWNELNRPEYRYLKQKQINDEPLTHAEEKWIEQYEDYLGEYFESLSAEEKNVYYAQKAEWYACADLTEIQPERDEKPRRDTELLLKHIGYSGISGLVYGIMLSNIFHLNEEACFIRFFHRNTIISIITHYGYDRMGK